MNNSIEEMLNSLSVRLDEKELVHKINNLIISIFFQEIEDISINPKFSQKGTRITSNGIRNVNGVVHDHYYFSMLDALKAYKVAVINYLKQSIEESKKYKIIWQVCPRIRKYERGYIAYGVFELENKS